MTEDLREPTRAALEHAYTVLIADCTAELRFDDHSLPLRYVVDNETGRLITSLPVAALLAVENVLFVPAETDDALQLMTSPEEIPESTATDRFLAFHGEPEHVRWAACWIDSARHGPWVFDGDAMMRPNPLAAREPALCKAINADGARLAALCLKRAGVAAPSPVCVGVDPLGVHVRARFGVIRIAFAEPATDEEAVRAAIEGMLHTSHKT